MRAVNTLNNGNDSAIEKIKKAGFNISGIGKIEHYPARRLYVSRGNVLKIDTVASTNSEMLDIGYKINFIPPKND
jgi:hypothetical protein